MATAYEPMGQAGVDGTSIADIAEHAQEVARLPVPELPPAQLNFMVFRDAKFGRGPTAQNAR